MMMQTFMKVKKVKYNTYTDTEDLYRPYGP